MRLKELVKKFASPLAVIISLEILVVGFTITGVLPREVSLFLLGIFAFFVIFAPLKHAALFAVFSIPLYTALPISESFDTMASWRIVVAILFLRSLLKLPGFKLSRSDLSRFVIQFLKTRLGFLVSTFFLLGGLSLLVAQEPIIGIRKLLYFANIFALFLVVHSVIKSRRDFMDVLKFSFAGSVLALAIGYAQFIAVLFVSLYNFWQWWAHNVIPVLYGINLANLLSYANTWFSYYGDAEPTLRIFSTFPDSHSFAFSMILALPMALTFLVAHKNRRSRALFFGGTVILSLFAIIFSGTRGAWVGAVPVFFVLVGVFLLFNKLKYGGWRGKSWNNIRHIFFSVARINFALKISIISFFIFAILFPLSSPILKFSQSRHGGEVSETTLKRISTSFSITELSNKGRIQIWKSTLVSIAKHPFLGVGIGNYPVVLEENVSATKRGASAHSLYLDVASEMGIVAMIVLLLMFAEIFWRAIKIFLQSSDHIFSAFAGFFAVYFLWVMAYSVVDVVLLNDKVLLLFVVLVGLLYSIPPSKNPKTKC